MAEIGPCRELPPAAVDSAASEVMMLGSGEFVMLLLRRRLLLMRWLLVLLLLLRPRGRTGARPEGVLPECGGELDHFVSAKCAAWMYRMRRSSTFGKGARWVCALSLAGGAGCGAGSGMFKPCRHYEFEF